MNSEFFNGTDEIINNITTNDKKKYGIYLTPYKPLHTRIKKTLTLNNTQNPTILEPSSGTGQFIDVLLQINPKFNITTIELYESLFKFSKQKYDKYNNIKSINQNFLTYNTNNKYDFIFGNPPYFTIPKNNVPDNYTQYINGRPNIYLIFLLKSLQLLNNNGILAFIIPRNFCNGIYYSKVREHIFQKYTILDIEHFECEFTNTKQKVLWITIQNKTPTNNNKFAININNHIFLNTPENITKMTQLSNNKQTLLQLGYQVKVGQTIWNQLKPFLSNNKTNQNHRLLYDSDLKQQNPLNHPTTFKNKDKGNYIEKDTTTLFKPPFLVFPRGGKGNTQLELNIHIINGNEPIAIENHILVIQKINGNDTTEELEIIRNKLLHNDTKEYIQLFTTNNMINCKELMNYVFI